MFMFGNDDCFTSFPWNANVHEIYRTLGGFIRDFRQIYCAEHMTYAWQTLKKLKGKQEENKKREMTRLMSKLDAQDKATPPITPITPASHPVEIMDDAYAPEDTGR